MGEQNQAASPPRLFSSGPVFSAVAAVSLDGRRSPTPDQPSDWTSTADKKMLKRILNGADWLVVGRVTYELHRRFLCRRRCLVLTGSAQTAWHQDDRLVFRDPRTLDLPEFFRQVGAGDVTVIGGCRTYSYCLERELIEYLYLTIEPVAFGSGPPLFDLQPGMCRRFQLDQCSADQESGSVFLRYRRLRP